MTAQATINQVSPAFVAWTTAPYAPFAENLPAAPAGQEDRLSRAAAILDKIRSSASPARLIADYLDEFDQLLPDLVELNIRQAVEEGRPALAQELKTLKSGFCPELVLPPLPFAEVRTQTEPAGFHGKVMLSSTSEYESPRMEHLQEVLKRQGCQVLNPDGQPITRENTPDVAVFSNPHLNPDLLEQMAVLSARGVPILLDLDRDFENLPVSHPDYTSQGLGVKTRGKAFSSALLLADAITVPSDVLAGSLCSAGYSAQVVPDAWSNANPLWRDPTPARGYIHIGISGAFCQLEDVTMIRRIILRAMREFTNTRLVILDHADLYHFFHHLDEERRYFLPSLKAESRPALLKQIDLLLVPLRHHPYNYAMSDRPLMEAGTRRIPWIATPVAAVKAWEKGGLTADTPEEWHDALREVLSNPALRAELGQAGKEKAQQRELHIIGSSWLQILQKTLQKATRITVA